MGTDRNTSSVGCGCLWSIPACIISYALNRSFWWALLHFFCGGFYIIYVVFARGREIGPALKWMFGL